MSVYTNHIRCSIRGYFLYSYRCLSTTQNRSTKKGLVLGLHCDKDKNYQLTYSAKKYDEIVEGKIVQHLDKHALKEGGARVLYNLCPDYDAVSLVGLPPQKNSSYNEQENIDELKEAIRIAASVGCRSLQELGVTEISVETFGDAEAAAEGSHLGIWKFQEFKNETKKKQLPQIFSYGTEQRNEWRIGEIKANAQNKARWFSDMPANHMTPTIFANEASKLLDLLNVDVKIRDKEWISEKKMGAFLSVTKGSKEPPVFLEATYKFDDKNPVVFVGKGVTFDSGGISIKPSKSMDEMRADMTGASCVVATIYAVAQLKLPINFTVLVPLCENMPSGEATKPGDIITAMNGKTIQVDNTDAEGRLILADALTYASSFNPRFTLDIATLTGAMGVALGGSATGVFTNSNNLWNQIEKAGAFTGDRVWRFPLWKYYTEKVTDYPSVDVNNVGKGKGGGSCTAAAFLKEFTPDGDWLHLDIASVMGPDNDKGYLHKGMAGRPTRTLIQFLSQIAKDRS